MNEDALLPLVMLPGMMCDQRLFNAQIDYFSNTRPVHVADISVADSISMIAQQVLDTAPEQFALAGLSMGGIVAMEMLHIAPERICGMALLDTNPLAEPPERQALRDLQIQKVQAGDLAEVIRSEMKPNYLASQDQQKNSQQAILDLCMTMAIDLGSEAFIRQSRALKGRKDQQANLAQTDIPVLVLMGQEDSLCPLKYHQLMAQLCQNAQLVVIPDAGHLPTLEQPKATNEALATWLKRI